jgi:hypothetical protein
MRLLDLTVSVEKKVIPLFVKNLVSFGIVYGFAAVQGTRALV